MLGSTMTWLRLMCSRTPSRDTMPTAETLPSPTAFARSSAVSGIGAPTSVSRFLGWSNRSNASKRYFIPFRIESAPTNSTSNVSLGGLPSG